MEYGEQNLLSSPPMKKNFYVVTEFAVPIQIFQQNSYLQEKYCVAAFD